MKINCFGGLTMLQFAPILGGLLPIFEQTFEKCVRICQIQNPWAECTFSTSWPSKLDSWTMDMAGAKSVLCQKKESRNSVPSTTQFYFPKARSTIKYEQIKGRWISYFMHIDFMHIICYPLVWSVYISIYLLLHYDCCYRHKISNCADIWEIYHKCWLRVVATCVICASSITISSQTPSICFSCRQWWIWWPSSCSQREYILTITVSHFFLYSQARSISRGSFKRRVHYWVSQIQVSENKKDYTGGWGWGVRVWIAE